VQPQKAEMALLCDLAFEPVMIPDLSLGQLHGKLALSFENAESS
jgi:hypothetical protein